MMKMMMMMTAAAQKLMKKPVSKQNIHSKLVHFQRAAVKQWPEHRIMPLYGQTLTLCKLNHTTTSFLGWCAGPERPLYTSRKSKPQ